MDYIFGGHELGKKLADAGLLPQECANVELLLPADGVMQLRYTVNVTAAAAATLGTALSELAQEARS